MKYYLALTLALAAALFAQEAPKPADATLTLYTPRRGTHSAVPSARPWISPLWVDHQMVTKIKLMPGHFLSLKLPSGVHAITGWNFWGHEGDAATTISLEPGKHYFVRLMDNSHVVLGWSGVSDFEELVDCNEAHRDGAALEPVKLKNVSEMFLDSVIRESYFPECEAKR